LARLLAAALTIGAAAMLVAGPAVTDDDFRQPEFTEEFLADMAVIREGRELFRGQCGHCHGSRAYPGKAPRLRPDRYEPDFVYWVVVGGYGQMPPFAEHFDHEDVRRIVAWVKSPYFSQ
jgi:mono/diheme cytochrome c family protein